MPFTYLGDKPASDTLTIYKYVASGSQTTFTGADANGITLSYDVGDGSCQVFLNGVRLDSSDVTATNGTSVVLAACTAGDIVHIQATKGFVSSDSVSASSGGTFSGAVTMGSTLSVPDGSAATPSLANTGDANTGVYFPAADTVGVVAGGTEQFRFGSNPVNGSRNLLINGAMTVYQHGQQTTAASNQYSLDRWCWHQSSGEGGTKSQNTSVPSGSGFAYSYKYDVTTAGGAPGAAEFNIIEQRIEAQNLQHLCYGNAAAKTLALSFWMSSPKSGTHCVALYQPDASRSYIREFTVASADTWEKFSVTFPGDASGTITNDNGAGLHVVFPMNVGSNYEATKDQWASGQDYATSSAQNLLDNTANNIYLTGIQLEVGGVSTDFEYEDYGTTLERCKRYYQKIEGAYGVSSGVSVDTTTQAVIIHRLAVQMRATPTATASLAGTQTLLSANTNIFSSLDTTAMYDSLIGYFVFTVSSGTAGRSGRWTMGAGSKLEWSAEL